jgi:hypothetical protein
MHLIKSHFYFGSHSALSIGAINNIALLYAGLFFRLFDTSILLSVEPCPIAG